MNKAKKSMPVDVRSNGDGGRSVSSPDTSKMQMIEIDKRTKIFISITASPSEAKNRYLNNLRAKRIKH